MARSAVVQLQDAAAEPPAGNVKATRDDWVNVARDLLVSDGVAQVKVLAIGDRLKVSRSSFYWYFKSRKHLLEALLDDWELRNTAKVVAACEAPANGVDEAVCNFFRCFLDPDQFDQGLDFAVREWSRRDGSVRQRIDAADGARLQAVAAMFERHGYEPDEADCRARILYFMQLGYHALEVREPMPERLKRLEGYVAGFTGRPPEPEAIAAFRAFAFSLETRA